MDCEHGTCIKLALEMKSVFIQGVGHVADKEAYTVWT